LIVRTRGRDEFFLTRSAEMVMPASLGLFVHSQRMSDGATATRQAGDEAACPTETVFFAFRLKAPGCFFWGFDSEG
jgi:hypothetical protein